MGNAQQRQKGGIYEANEVIPRLWIGSRVSALDIDGIKDWKVTHILSVMKDLRGIQAYTSPIKHKVVPVLDLPTEDLYKYFPECIEFIQEGRDAGGVLVHCFAGASRSVSVTIAYMMFEARTPYEEAFSRLRKLRTICPNEGFVSQLRQFESELRQQRSRSQPPARLALFFRTRRVSKAKRPSSKLSSIDADDDTKSPDMLKIVPAPRHDENPPNTTTPRPSPGDGRRDKAIVENGADKTFVTSTSAARQDPGAGADCTRGRSDSDSDPDRRSHLSPSGRVLLLDRSYSTGSVVHVGASGAVLLDGRQSSSCPVPLAVDDATPLVTCKSAYDGRNRARARIVAGHVSVSAENSPRSSPPPRRRFGVMRATRASSKPSRDSREPREPPRVPGDGRWSEGSGDSSAKAQANLHTSGPGGDTCPPAPSPEPSPECSLAADASAEHSSVQSAGPATQTLTGSAPAASSKSSGGGVAGTTAGPNRTAGSTGSKPVPNRQGAEEPEGSESRDDGDGTVGPAGSRDQPGAGSDVTYRCRMCRTVLFSEGQVVSHAAGGGQEEFAWKKRDKAREGSLACSSVFVEPMDWMHTDGVEGKLLCKSSKCSARIGSYAWQGLQCSCGSWVTPAFQVLKNRVDPSVVTTLLTSPVQYEDPQPLPRSPPET